MQRLSTIVDARVRLSAPMSVRATCVALLCVAALGADAPAGPPPGCFCSADLNDNGVVDGADLGILLGAWGSAGFSTDLNDDGVVDGADLGILLGLWGPCGPDNDFCSTATTIVADSFQNVCTWQANTDGPVVNGACGPIAQQIFADIWFNWVAPAAGTLTLDTCQIADFDSIIAVYASTVPGAPGCPGAVGEPSTAVIIGCNDDVPGCPNNGSMLTVPVVGGTWYTIRVGGFNGATGNEPMHVVFTAATP